MAESGDQLGHGLRGAAVAVFALGWPIAAGVILGAWIDARLSTSPFATIAIAIGGFVGAVWRMIRLSEGNKNA